MEFDEGLFQSCYDKKEAAAFWAKDLRSIREQRQAREASFTPHYGNDREAPTKLIVGLGAKAAIKIVRMGSDWRVIETACALARERGKCLAFSGQSLATLAFQLLLKFMSNARGHPPPELYEALKKRQCNKCAICHMELPSGPGAVHLDYRKPLVDGRQEEDFSRPELYQLLDRDCHANKTLREEEARVTQDGGRIFLGCHSQFLPELHDIFHDPGLKPKQMSGCFGDETSPPRKDLVGYDINSCRPAALEKCGVEEGLPVFCVTDRLVELTYYLGGVDFHLVEGGQLIWRQGVARLLRTGGR